MQSVEVEEPAVLIRIPRLYRSDMSRRELYDAVRGTWRIEPRCENVQIALAVAGGIVREVYTIAAWHPAGTTPYEARDTGELKTEGRWEFIGNVAPARIRDKYIGRSVAHYFRQGQTNPILYVNA